MCLSKRSNPFSGNFNPFDPLDMSHILTDSESPLHMTAKTKDKWEGLYESLHILGGKVQRENSFTGINRRAESAAKAAERLAFVNPAPNAPEATAGVLDPAADVRNRRRRAVLLGVSQLRAPDQGVNSPQF